ARRTIDKTRRYCRAVLISARSLAEHRTDGFFIADTAHGLGNDGSHVQLTDALAAIGSGSQWNGVGDYQFIQQRGVDIVDRLAGQDGVGAIGGYAHGAEVLEGLGGGAQGAGGIDHIVDQNAVAAFHITDDVHDLGLVGLGATLVDDRQIHAQALGHSAGANHTADVRGHDQQVVQALGLDVVDQHRGAVDVVHRDVEETLDLVSVQVNCQYPINTDHIQHVRYYLGADRHPGRTRAAVLPGVTEVGDDGGDARGRGATQGIGHDNQFHQVVVG